MNDASSAPESNASGDTGGQPPGAPSAPARLRFPPFEIDPKAHQLSRNGELVSLTPKVFDTLLVLVSRRGGVVSKEELMRAVWHDTHVSDESLVQAISMVRRALGDDSAQPTYVATVAKRGYRFLVRVEEVFDAEMPPPVETPAIPAATRAIVAPPEVAPRRVPWLAAGGALLVALSGLLGAVLMRSADTAPAPPLPLARLQYGGPRGTTLASGGTLSPDATRLAFVARDDESRMARLWSLDIETGEAAVLPGTDGASKPFWAPDSSAVGFFADGHLKITQPGGSTVQVLAPSGITPAGGSWSSSGSILFASSQAGISTVSATGMNMRSVTTLDTAAEEAGHEFPQWLPGGTHFLYFVVSGNRARAGTYVGSINKEAPKRLLDGTASPAVYSADGYLLYVRDRTLFAHAFDPTALELTGNPVRIATDVTPPSRSTNSVLSAAQGGILAFGGAPHERLAWYDRAGTVVDVPSQSVTLRNPRLSVDGRVALGNGPDTGRRGVWTLDVDRNALARVTSEGRLAVPSPDGSRFAFNSDRSSGAGDIYIAALGGGALGGASLDLLVKSAEPKFLNDWSRDGRYIVYVNGAGSGRQHLWFVPLDGDRTPRPYLQSSANEIQGQLSPDSRWIAYASDESGRWEVQIQSFPEPGVKSTISTGGGTQPQWRADGRELFYIDSDGWLMAVEVSGTTPLSLSRPTRLFRTPIAGEPVNFRNHYAVRGDGQRFLFSALDLGAVADPITLMVNWMRGIGEPSR